MAKLAVTLMLAVDVGVGARVGRRVVAPLDEVVACAGNRRHRRAAGAVVDRLGVVPVMEPWAPAV